MDISKLKHIADFNVKCAVLGEIRCGPFGNDELSKIDKMARDKVSGEALARYLILTLGRKLTGEADVDEVAGGPSLTEGEVAQLSKDELDDFCDQFVVRRLRSRSGTLEVETKSEDNQGTVKSGVDGLCPAIVAHTDSQHAQIERILGSKSATMKGAFARVHDNVLATEALHKSSIWDQVRKQGVGGTIADQVNKLSSGGILDQTRRDALGVSAVEAAIRAVKASDNLGESIAALRASEDYANRAMAFVVPEKITITPPQIPPNPILETNNLLREQQAYAKEIRPTIIRSAELIQTLADTTLTMQALANDNSKEADRHAQRSMRIAIISIVIAIITGITSIYYAKGSPTAEQVDLLAKDLHAQANKVIISNQADRIAFEKKAAEDRAMLVEMILQQAELIKELKKKNGTYGPNNTNAPK